MEEVTNIGALEKGQIYIKEGDLAYRAYRLAEAFTIAGTNAAPLFPQLRDEFLSGRSVWGAECGLLFIGSDAWTVFLQGLTNSDRKVRVVAMSGMSFSNAPPSSAALAFPYLCRFATNESEPLAFRQFAERCIGSLAVRPEVKVPALISIAEVETNWFSKCVVIDEIGSAGLDNKDVREFLERTSKDKNEHVRAFCEKALRELKASK
jgi:hypothetical protein